MPPKKSNVSSSEPTVTAQLPTSAPDWLKKLQERGLSFDSALCVYFFLKGLLKAYPAGSTKSGFNHTNLFMSLELSEEKTEDMIWFGDVLKEGVRAFVSNSREAASGETPPLMDILSSYRATSGGTLNSLMEEDIFSSNLFAICEILFEADLLNRERFRAVILEVKYHFTLSIGLERLLRMGLLKQCAFALIANAQYPAISNGLGTTSPLLAHLRTLNEDNIRKLILKAQFYNQIKAIIEPFQKVLDREMFNTAIEHPAISNEKQAEWLSDTLQSLKKTSPGILTRTNFYVLLENAQYVTPSFNDVFSYLPDSNSDTIAMQQNRFDVLIKNRQYAQTYVHIFRQLEAVGILDNLNFDKIINTDPRKLQILKDGLSSLSSTRLFRLRQEKFDELIQRITEAPVPPPPTLPSWTSATTATATPPLVDQPLAHLGLD